MNKFQMPTLEDLAWLKEQFLSNSHAVEAEFCVGEREHAEMDAERARASAILDAVEKLEAQLLAAREDRQQIERALRAVNRAPEGEPPCWCDRYTPPDGRHSEECQQARAALLPRDPPQETTTEPDEAQAD